MYVFMYMKNLELDTRRADVLFVFMFCIFSHT